MACCRDRRHHRRLRRRQDDDADPSVDSVMNNVLTNVFQSVYICQYFDNISEIVDKTIRIPRLSYIVIITRSKGPFFLNSEASFTMRMVGRNINTLLIRRLLL